MDTRSPNTKIRSGDRTCKRQGTKKKEKPDLNTLIESKLAELEQKVSEEPPVSHEDDGLPSPRSTALAVLQEKGKKGIQELLHSETTEVRAVEKEVAALRKKIDAIVKEKDAITVEINKQAQQKVKVEHDCRELQLQNKSMQEDSAARAKDEQTRKEEITGKLKGSIDDITMKMEAQTEENERMASENAALEERLNAMQDSIKEKLKEFELEMKMKESEVQLLGARVQEQMRKTDTTSIRVATLEQTITAYSKNEAMLREQTQLYSARLGEFRDAKEKSFEYTKQTIDQLQRLNAAIEELTNSRQDIEEKRIAANKEREIVVRQMAELRKKHSVAEKAKQQSETACRALQKERTDLKEREKSKVGGGNIA